MIARSLKVSVFASVMVALGGGMFLAAQHLTGQGMLRGAQGSGCAASSAAEVVVQDHLKLVRADGRRVDLLFENTVVQSLTAVDYLTAVFVNDRQVETLLDRYTIPCGTMASRRYSVEVTSRADVVSVVYWRDPDVPKPLLNLDPSKVWDLPEARLANMATFTPTTQRAQTLVGVPDQHPLPVNPPVRFVPLSGLAHPNNHIAERGTERPVLFKVLRPGQPFDFTVRFADAASLSAAITITCLVDKRQIVAFSGSRSWTGLPQSTMAVEIEGQAVFDRAGWHQLECLAFDNLARPSSGDPTTYWTLGTFVYVR